MWLGIVLLALVLAPFAIRGLLVVFKLAVTISLIAFAFIAVMVAFLAGFVTGIVRLFRRTPPVPLTPVQARMLIRQQEFVKLLKDLRK